MTSWLPRPAGGWRVIALRALSAERTLRLAFAVYLVCAIVAIVWVGRYSLSIRHLRQGVGNTTFFTADGRPWFRLEEHRRDVPLAQISPHLREAVIAVEDHRFYRHQGIDPIAFGRALWRD